MVTSGTSAYGELCPLTVQQVNGYVHCLKTHQPGLITRAVFWMDVILQYLKIGRKKSKQKLGISRKYEEQKRYKEYLQGKAQRKTDSDHITVGTVTFTKSHCPAPTRAGSHHGSSSREGQAFLL